jgi:hypothetical protein
MLRIFLSYPLKGYDLVGNVCQTRCKRKILGLRLYRGNKEKWNLIFHPNLKSIRFHAIYILLLYLFFSFFMQFFYFLFLVFSFLLCVKVVIFNFECFLFWVYVCVFVK